MYFCLSRCQNHNDTIVFPALCPHRLDTLTFVLAKWRLGRLKLLLNRPVREAEGCSRAVSNSSTSFGPTGPPSKATIPENMVFHSQDCGFPCPAGAELMELLCHSWNVSVGGFGLPARCEQCLLRRLCSASEVVTTCPHLASPLENSARKGKLLPQPSFQLHMSHSNQVLLECTCVLIKQAAFDSFSFFRA